MNLQRNQQTVPEGCEEDLLTLNYCCKENTTYLPSSNQTWLADACWKSLHVVWWFSQLSTALRAGIFQLAMVHETGYTWAFHWSSKPTHQWNPGTQSVAKVLVVHYFLPGSIWGNLGTENASKLFCRYGTCGFHQFHPVSTESSGPSFLPQMVVDSHVISAMARAQGGPPADHNKRMQKT